MTLKGKYEYRRKLPHLQSTRHPIFVTFNTKDKWILSERARDIILEACLCANGKRIDVSLQELIDKTMGAKLPRADLHISRTRDGELLIHSRQDGMIRMLMP